MKVHSIDHIVMTVKSIEKSCKFYQECLGLEIITFQNDRKALKCGNQKINLHEIGHEFDPKAKNASKGTVDICLIVENPIAEIVKDFEKKGVEIIEGPIKRTGATHKLLSIYVFDPDGNLIELSNSM